LDQTEAHWSGLDGRRGALLMIGFESADHPQTASMDRALAVLQSNAAESADIVYSDIQQDAPSVALLSKSTGCLRPYCRYL